MAKIKALAMNLANLLPEVAAGSALLAFSISAGAFSFIGTIASAVVMTFGVLSIDFSKYEKGGEQ